jgi:hypothetical protein
MTIAETIDDKLHPSDGDTQVRDLIMTTGRGDLTVDI